MTKVVRSCRDPLYLELVFEYILHMGLFNTAETLKKECFLKKFLILNDTEARMGTVLKLLEHFDHGNKEYVFELLDSSISQLKQSTLDYKKLVADLHIHFASKDYAKYPSSSDDVPSDILEDVENGCGPQKSVGRGNPKIIIGSHDDKSSVQSSLHELRKFLERKCANLRDHSEFIPYFSLLFVPNPITHDLFGQALQASWTRDLRRRLECIGLHYLAVEVPKIVLHLPSNIEHGLGQDHPTVESDETEEDADQILHCNFSHQDTHDIVLHDGVENNLEENRTGPTMRCDSEENQALTFSGSSYVGSEKAPLVHTHNKSPLFFKRRNKTRPFVSSRSNQTSGNQISTSESSSTDDKFQEYRVSYTRLKERFSQLHSDYHNLIGVTTELTGALEHSVRGHDVDLRETLNNCLKIFPELFSHSHHQNKAKPKATFEKSLGRSGSCEWNLHISRLKKDLLDGNVKTRLLLLQALRWAITKSSFQQREYVMDQLIEGDLLNLQEDFLLNSLLSPPGVATPHPLQQSAARLINTMASVRSGRSYLARNAITVNVTTAVMQQLDGIHIDTVTKNMLMAALQKLSLRRNQRIAMIELGMVEWLFQDLCVVESSYSLEYGTALLMNLCLHQSAKERCVPIAQSVVNLLMNLLSTPVIQALPYINGTLYSLLNHPQINQVAAKAGISKALEKNLQIQKNDEIKKQFEHILQFHQSLLFSGRENSVPVTVCEGEMIDEDNEELDLLGEELDEQDPVRSISGELIGEELLRAHYTLATQSHGYPDHKSLLKGRPDSSYPLILRPTTPHHSGQSTPGMTSEDSDGVVVARILKVSNRQKETIRKSNYHLKRASLKHQSTDKEQGISRYQSVGSDTISRSGHVSVSENLSQSRSDMGFNTGEAEDFSRHPTVNHFERPEEEGKEPTDISLSHENNGDAETSDNCDIDEDSKDVLVGSSPHRGTIQEHNSDFCYQSQESADLSDTVKSQNKDDPTSENEKYGTAAFASRPKIPRTPPRHT